MTLSTPISIQSLVDQAFDRLVEAIVRGELVPGSRLGEAQVAKQLGISRGPLREALVRLESRKLVARKPNCGVTVVDFSEADLDELFTVREALEGMACRLAATAMADSEIAGLIALLERHGADPDVRDGSAYYQGADDDFHFRIVRGSRNTRLIAALCDELHDQVRFYRYRSSTRPGRTRQAYDEHRQIAAALQARDPDRAEAAMRRHIANARINLLWRNDGSKSTATGE